MDRVYWNRNGTHRTAAFYTQAHAVAQRKADQHWHAVTKAREASSVSDETAWNPQPHTRPPPRISCKFEKVSRTTLHADKRTHQRRLRPGTQVHAVIDDRTGTLFTAWDPKAKPQAKPKARSTPARARETLQHAEKRLDRLIRGAASHT